MKTLLRLDCSSRSDNSVSKGLAEFFEKKWLEANPEGNVIYRDLLESNVPHITGDTIAGFNIPLENKSEKLVEATKLSDSLIQELKNANDVIISSPLYNLTIPSSLKAYIDQIVRYGYTFEIDEHGYHGLLTEIRAFLITVKGGVMKDTPFEKFDFQDPYLKAILNFIGIRVEKLFSLEGTAQKQLAEKQTKKIKKEISNYFKN